MKKILFPTDFSANADHALKYAILLCKHLEAELVIFHSCHINAFAYQLLAEETNEEIVLKNTTEQLVEYCNLHSTETKGIKVSQVVEYGLAVYAIVEVAKRLKVQLIVMGTKGAKGLEKVLIGSNTIAVIEKAHCPVFTIPAKTRIRKIEQIVFATDFKDSDIKSIEFLSQIAALFNGKIFIVHVADFLVPGNYENALLDVFEEDVRKNISYKNLSFQTLKGINPAKALNEFIKESEIDLIAVSTRRKNIFEKLFETSFTKKIAYHTNIPLLAFHVKEKYKPI